VPAAAVIPAPIAYIKVVAVKKLVVELLQNAICCIFRDVFMVASAFWRRLRYFIVPAVVGGIFTLRKLECFKQAFALNTAAWNNDIGL
jgi:hypothetical protein